MRRTAIVALALLAASCASVKPLDSVKNWKRFDMKTRYAVRETEQDSAYLTVEYAPFTVLNKTAETVPAAKTIFKKIAVKLAQERGYRSVTVVPDSYYVAADHGGASGVTRVLVSNEIHFENAPPEP
jgi:hypothetical protein